MFKVQGKERAVYDFPGVYDVAFPRIVGANLRVVEEYVITQFSVVSRTSGYHLSLWNLFDAAVFQWPAKGAGRVCQDGWLYALGNLSKDLSTAVQTIFGDFGNLHIYRNMERLLKTADLPERQHEKDADFGYLSDARKLFHQLADSDGHMYVKLTPSADPVLEYAGFVCGRNCNDWN